MISISCPRCGHAIEVDETRRTSRGKIRVKCKECGAKLSMRPRKGGAPGPPASGPEPAAAPAAVDAGAFGLGGELSDGEISLPGDLDEENSVQVHIDAGADAEAAESRQLAAAAEDLAALPDPLEGEESDESLARVSSLVSRADEADSSAFGMSMEMEVPVRKSKRRSSGELSPSDYLGEFDGDAPSRMVISNLADLDGYRIEPLGMVTHAFCRKAGGEGIEAKKRIHAFGTRYRKALADLAEQAQALGGNTVLGIEIQMQPTGLPETPVVWVVVQGTAAVRKLL